MIDALNIIYTSTANLTSATNTSGWFDLKTGTPRRGMPVQLLIRPDVTATSTTSTATMAGTLPTATVTIEATDDTSGSIYTVASFDIPGSAATTTTRQTEIVSTDRRYMRAKILLGGTSPTLLANAFMVALVGGGKPS